MKPNVLLLEDSMTALPIFPLISEDFTVHVLPETGERGSVLARAGASIRAVITTTYRGADAALIAALPALEIICNAGGYLDRLDLAAARARGLAVTYTPGVSAADVADLAVALILAVARRICEADRFVRAGLWRQGMMAFGSRVNGKRLGIVGLGRIGRIVARRALGFGMSVVYHGPHRKDDVPYRYATSLDGLAGEVDFLVVACSAGAATRRIIGAPVIRALGPQGILVNFVRGAVDDAALIAALRAGAIGGAGLDTLETQPDVPPELAAMENVVLSPLIGSWTRETKRALSERTAANLRAYFARRPLLDTVIERSNKSP